MIKFEILPTDALLYVLIVGILIFIIGTLRNKELRRPWRFVGQRKLAMIAFVVLLGFVIIGLLDSIHYYSVNNPTEIKSVLDALLSPLGQHHEKTYSAPFSSHLYSKEVITSLRGQYRGYPQLRYVSNSISILQASLIAFAKGMVVWLLALALFVLINAKRQRMTFLIYCRLLFYGQTKIVWREIWITIGVMILFAFWAYDLSRIYHILGTDQVGADVFYQTVKSIRTGLMIGTLTTLIMLPFAIILGMLAGYFRGWVDDVVQYVYTTLSSIPGVLLISAAILALQVFISVHPKLFPTLMLRADARLLALCLLLGITSWTGLCRLLRAETLKLRTADYVQAAKVLGVGDLRILMRHILPNIMHIILITMVLDFSGLVLAEAVLSYVGVGVDPMTLSWGMMINSARLQLARDPIVWWPLLAAFIFMFILVLSANIFADAVRDAFDPKLTS